MKVLIDIPKETKEIFDKASDDDIYGTYCDYNSLIGKAIKNGTPIPDNATNEFYVIDKRIGKEPIFDHNHIFKEKWFKESGLIWCDIDGWYISEDGTLVLVDDCGKVAYPPIDRFEIVWQKGGKE